MATFYSVKITDQLLRFDTTKDDVVVTMLPFAQTPNAPYQIQRTSTGDGHTVTVQVAGAPDFLLPDGSTALTLDDTTYAVTIKIPADGLSPAYVAWGSGGGGSGGSVTIPAAPPVTICGVAGSPCTTPPDILPRNNGVVEIDVFWLPAASATAANFAGAAVYIEDPDISSGAQAPLNGTTQLNATSQMSGQWAPVFQNNSTASPAVVLIQKQAGVRPVRIYLAAFGKNAVPILNRANGPNPTPSIVVNVPGQQTGQSGQEYAFLVTNPVVNVVPDYNRPDPNYYLTFGYTPPDPTIPIPANLQPFSGCRIIFVPTDATDTNPQFSAESDPGLFVPTVWAAGYKSPIYDPSHPASNGAQFRCYFLSQDTLGDINSLVEGVTPYALASIPQITPAPDVTNFTISSPATVWLADGSFVNQATLAWTLPTSAQYAGVVLYLVNVTGTAPVSKFPMALTPQQANVDVGFVLQIPNGMGAVIPADDETWTIAAISVSAQGALADDPTKYGQSGFHSPTVTWTVGPPTPGSAGSGQEYAPFVTVSPTASITATESTSSDGVRMVSFQVGSWTDPASNQFGGAKVAMIVNHDPSTATYWDVGMATSFTTPSMPAPGNFGQPIPISFYIVSYDPQGNQNELIQGTTPRIPPYSGAAYNYTPTQGAVIPARSGWFDTSQFDWTANPDFTAVNFAANIINVGSTLVVGGAPSSGQTQFGGAQNGQIAVKDSSNNLLGWIGMQQPTQGNGQPLYGAWFKQLWVGGSNPLSAPLFVDNQGIIEVGGIAAAQGATYPYISVRDSTGHEAGRIGAQISSTTDSTGNTGPSPPTLTAGAWFTQLAVGGSSLSNWNVLITPSATNPLGSNFQMRNIALLSIDYPQNSAPAGYFNNEYRFDVGNSVWMAAGLSSGTWVFPGIHIYEVDNNQNNFGATFISRGMVLRGTQQQNYQVLASLVSYNGNSTGQDSPATFYGELTMFSPVANIITVDLAGGSTTSNNPYFRMFDLSGNPFLWVDIDHFAFRVNGTLQGMNGAPVTANAYNIYGYGPVIDATGKWLGLPIAAAGGGQTPWTSQINAAGNNLVGAGEVQAATFNTASANFNGNVINQYGQFVGPGVQTNQGVGCSGVTSTGGITCTTLNATQNVTTAQSFFTSSTVFNGAVINTYGQFVGPGINVQGNGITCGYLSTAGGGPNEVDCGTLKCSGTVTASTSFAGGSFSGSSITVTGSCNASGGYTGGAFNGSGVSVSGNCSASGSLTGAGLNISSGNYSGNVINTYGQFIGPGINVGTNNGIGCGSVSCVASASQSGQVACLELTCYNTTINASGISTQQQLTAAGLTSTGDVTCSGTYYNAGVAIIANGIFEGHGVQCNSAVYASSFGIYGVAVGWNGTFTTNDGRTAHVNGGIITSVA
jgi:hypothetical protein